MEDAALHPARPNPSSGGSNEDEHPPTITADRTIITARHSGSPAVAPLSVGGTPAESPAVVPPPGGTSGAQKADSGGIRAISASEKKSAAWSVLRGAVLLGTATASTEELLARHRQVTARAPLNTETKTASLQHKEESPPVAWSPAHVEPVSTVKSGLCDEEGPAKPGLDTTSQDTAMRKISFRSPGSQPQRRSRGSVPDSSPAHRTADAPSSINGAQLDVQSKQKTEHILKGAPTVVSASRIAQSRPARPVVNIQPLEWRHQLELESMAKKFCVSCGNEMGIGYQFCQRCGTECAILSPRPAPTPQDVRLAVATPVTRVSTPDKTSTGWATIRSTVLLGAATEEARESAWNPGALDLLTPALAMAENANDRRPKYDVYISYRSSADLKHAKNMYRELSAREVEDGGKKRKLTVYWDRISARGEGLELRSMQGAEAMCSSSVVVAIISRGTFVISEARKDKPEHNMAFLSEQSPTDHVLWDWYLALQVSAMRGQYPRVVLPVFVGDARHEKTIDDVYYTDFFTSKCAPLEMPEVHVRKLHERLKLFLHARFHCVGKAPDAVTMNIHDCLLCKRLREWSVYEIVDQVFQLQNVSVSGLCEPAWNDCYSKIEAIVCHVCSQRDVERLQFSHPFGHEVVDWLQTHALSDLSATFARLQLDSLHKISRMTRDQVASVCAEAEEGEIEAKSVTGHSRIFPMGMHIVLSEAVEALKRDERANTLSDRLKCYQDVGCWDLVNLIWRQNQIAVILSNRAMRSFLVLALFVVGAVGGSLVWVEFVRNPWFPAPYVSSAARRAANFSAAYLIVLFIPASLIHVLQGVFPKHITPGLALNLNLVYASFLSMLGLILVRMEESLSNHLKRNVEWRANLMVRAEATILSISLLLLLCKFVAPQAFFLTALVCIVSACGIQTIDFHVLHDQPWHDGLIVLLVGYTCIILLILANRAFRRHVAEVTMMPDLTEYIDIWGDASGSMGTTLDPRKANAIKIKRTCHDVQECLKRTRIQHVSLCPWWQQVAFWARCGACGNYGRNGKRRQETTDVDVLFYEAILVAPSFFHDLDALLDHAASQLASKSAPAQNSADNNGVLDVSSSSAALHGHQSHRMSFVLRQAPVKRPGRALQKVVRKYFGDGRCLTDLVRGSVLVDSMFEMLICLEALLSRSEIRHANDDTAGSEQVQNELAEDKIFVLTKIKDTLCVPDTENVFECARQSICLNLEVAWDGAVGSSHTKLLPVCEWHLHPHSVRRHICEVEILLRDTYSHSVKCHSNYVRYRDLLYR